jgi:hypothetical protein
VVMTTARADTNQTIEVVPTGALRTAKGNPRQFLDTPIWPEFIPRRCQPLDVRPYPGKTDKFGVLDGRTRLVNMRHFNIHTCLVRVHWDLEEEEDGAPLEYQVGWELNYARRGLKAIDSFVARAKAGHPDQMAIMEIVERSGLTVSSTNTNLLAVGATGTLERLYFWGVLEETLLVSVQAYPPNAPGGRHQICLYSIGVFLKAHMDDLPEGSITRLIRVLQAVEPVVLRRRIQARREIGRESAGEACLRQMEQIFNAHRKEPLAPAKLPVVLGSPYLNLSGKRGVDQPNQQSSGRVQTWQSRIATEALKEQP